MSRVDMRASSLCLSNVYTHSARHQRGYFDLFCCDTLLDTVYEQQVMSLVTSTQ